MMQIIYAQLMDESSYLYSKFTQLYASSISNSNNLQAYVNFQFF